MAAHGPGLFEGSRDRLPRLALKMLQESRRNHVLGRTATLEAWTPILRRSFRSIRLYVTPAAPHSLKSPTGAGAPRIRIWLSRPRVTFSKNAVCENGPTSRSSPPCCSISEQSSGLPDSGFTKFGPAVHGSQAERGNEEKRREEKRREEKRREEKRSEVK